MTETVTAVKIVMACSHAAYLAKKEGDEEAFRALQAAGMIVMQLFDGRAEQPFPWYSMGRHVTVLPHGVCVSLDCFTHEVKR